MPGQELKQYYADIYLRLSKEDGDKEESDSITNQRELILDFLKSMPDIHVHSIRVDDGFSGVNFNRPAFNAMIEDIQAGQVNCVIVKDFSRFGRNYIEAGRYIQVLFPQSGVRFIAVTDHYDSARVNGYTDSIIVPFKNMVNEWHVRDIFRDIASNSYHFRPYPHHEILKYGIFRHSFPVQECTLKYYQWYARDIDRKRFGANPFLQKDCDCTDTTAENEPVQLLPLYPMNGLIPSGIILLWGGGGKHWLEQTKSSNWIEE